MTPTAPRAPGTLVRVLFLLAAVGFASLLLTAGFPPGAPDRLPVFVFALLLAVLGAAWPVRAIALFAFLFPCAGLIARASGGTEPAMWPGVLLAGLLLGWCFRFVYDFESRSEPAPSDRALRALVTVWTLATLVAAARAVTPWALLHGLSGRAVNGEGLLAGVALKETLFAFASLAGGAAFYFVLRRAGPDARRRALSGALAGVSVSAVAAVLQRLGILSGETRPYWKLIGRLSGGAVDPNSLGMLCGLFLLVSFSRTLQPGRRRTRSLVLFLVLSSGLVLSGSRSGGLVAGIGLVLLLLAPALPARARVSAVVALALVGAAVVLASLVVGGPGSLAARVRQTFDPALPAEYRLSARPLLWRAAERLFLRHPVVGEGMGAFAWRVPDLLAGEGRTLPTRDNPGSGYVQALAETGALGFAVTAVAALAFVVQGVRLWRSRTSPPEESAAGVAVVVFLGVLAIGSHWLAADVSLAFFLLAATCAVPGPDASSRRSPWASLLRWPLTAAVVVYAVAAAVTIFEEGSPDATFRYSRRIGFHELERGPGGTYRWTRQRFALWMVPGEPPLRLGLANFGPTGAPVQLEVRTQGRLVSRRSIPPGGATAYWIAPGRVPAAVTFETDRSFVPRRLGGSTDRRRLGLLSNCSADAGR